MTDAVLSLTEALVAMQSTTPADAGCQALLRARLEPLGFQCHSLTWGPAGAEVTNLWAIRRGHLGDQGKTLVFAGHTDVVPTGPLSQWASDPFTPTHRDGRLFGRGVADMKASLAAMIVAAERFLAACPDPAHHLALLVTSDEEGPSVDGTVKVVQWLKEQGQPLDWCVVGEPTSVHELGDMIKNGRRGSLSGHLVIHGQQGHVAYPDKADNPIHRLAPALAELCATHWDDGNAFFPPTTFQVSNVQAGTGAGNVIPGEAAVWFNFRFSTASTSAGLKDRVHALLDRHGLRHTLTWTLSGEAFLTPPGPLVGAMQAAIHETTGREAELSTSGGTSDGRFIAQICREVVEFGPLNATIHQVNEHLPVDQLEPLARVYQGVMGRLLSEA